VRLQPLAARVVTAKRTSGFSRAIAACHSDLLSGTCQICGTPLRPQPHIGGPIGNLAHGRLARMVDRTLGAARAPTPPPHRRSRYPCEPQ
jgi:hypothetical protein